jgi:hypothetical protein
MRLRRYYLKVVGRVDLSCEQPILHSVSNSDLCVIYPITPARQLKSKVCLQLLYSRSGT